MNQDIRITTTFFAHRKTKKLQRMLGADGILAVISLWTGVAISKPDGLLDGWDEEDIALEANYEGDAKTLINALLKTGFLEKNENGVFSVHNWQKRQPWAANHEHRKLSATKNQLKRWCLRQLGTKKERELFAEWYESYTYKSGDNTESILSVYGSYRNSK